MNNIGELADVLPRAFFAFVFGDPAQAQFSQVFSAPLDEVCSIHLMSLGLFPSFFFFIFPGEFLIRVVFDKLLNVVNIAYIRAQSTSLRSLIIIKNSL